MNMTSRLAVDLSDIFVDIILYVLLS